MSIGITDIIAPLGVFPALEDISLKGGYQTVADVTARDAIATNQRKVGMLVYTVATTQLWVLGPGITNGDWTISVSGASVTSTAPVDVTKAAAAVGTSIEAARADHKHDITTAAVSGLTHQATSSEGTATTLARSDHVHGFTAPAAPANVLVQTAAAGTAVTMARADHLHNITTAAPTTGIGGANAVGTSTSLARADHNHVLRTTTGPTDLAIGAIVDGEFLKRSGTSIISATAGGAITTQEEGATVSTTVTTLNFVGLPVTVTGGGATATVTLAPLGGTTATRPVTPAQYTSYFDTTLGLPITYFGVVWVNAAGVTV